jgi:4-cresol dehydrogenase (hydroxylating)
MSDALLRERARRYQIFPWTGVGALYGEQPMVAAAKRLVRQRLRGKVKRLFFMTPTLARRVHGLACLLPAGGGRLGNVTDKLDKTLRLLAGEPSEIALPLAYWKSGRIPDNGRMDPARDGCGLIWYSPLVPMMAERVRTYVGLVENICIEHGIEPLITLTSISPRCFDSTVPILFNRDDPAEAERADACYRALFEMGRGEGFLPYRMGVQYMDLVTVTDSVFWRLVAKIKQAVDPGGIIAPGRYSPRE